MRKLIEVSRKEWANSNEDYGLGKVLQDAKNFKAMIEIEIRKEMENVNDPEESKYLDKLKEINKKIDERIQYINVDMDKHASNVASWKRIIDESEENFETKKS